MSRNFTLKTCPNVSLLNAVKRHKIVIKTKAMAETTSGKQPIGGGCER